MIEKALPVSNPSPRPLGLGWPTHPVPGASGCLDQDLKAVQGRLHRLAPYGPLGAQ